MTRSPAAVACAAMFAFAPTLALAQARLPALPEWRLEPPKSLAEVEPTVPTGFPIFDSSKYVPGQPLPPGMQPPPEYPYKSGDMLPEGYHIEERPKRGLVVAGYLVTGIPYGMGLMVGAAKEFHNEMHWLALPVAGPWLTFAFRKRACNEIGETAFDSWDCVWDRTSEWFLVADGVIQAAGATLLIVGYSSTTPFAVRDEDQSFGFAPALVGSGYGLVTWGQL